MKKVRCRDVTRRDCDWAFVGQNEDEVMRREKEHAASMHQQQASELSDAQIRSAIREGH